MCTQQTVNGMEWSEVLFCVVAVAAPVAFLVSASVGMGGSLILVPVLALTAGTKEGVALAALLLAGNNVFKFIAYRKTIPLRAALAVVVLTAVGAFVGARLLVAVPEHYVAVAVILSLVAAFVSERRGSRGVQDVGAPALAFAAGATSGFSGSSGPLKGIALRSLRLDRRHLVGAAALVSLVGDATKVVVFAQADLLCGNSFLLAAAAIPLMFGATFLGRRLNRTIGEKGYERLFWAVMTGYTVRLIVAL